MRYIPVVTLLAALLSGCISKTTVDNLTQQRDYYKSESRSADSLRRANAELAEANMLLQADLNRALADLDQAKAANHALNNSYENLLIEYNRMVAINRNVEAAIAYETQKLRENLAAKEAQLDFKQRELTNVEYALQTRNEQLEEVASYDTFGARGASNTSQSAFKTALDNQNRQLNQLQLALGRALASYGAAAVQVSLKDNRVVVSLSHSFLFTEGGFQPTAFGVKALNDVAAVLAGYSNIDILVAARGDSYGASDTNLEYALRRAALVARTLVAAGVPAGKVLATGQMPELGTAFGLRPVIDQTEIIISPDMAPVWQAMGK